MFFLRKPSEHDVRVFISSKQAEPFSYREVGATQGEPPAGYRIDHNRTKLGEGEETFRRAVAALKQWQHFELGWVKIVPPNSKPDVDAVVAVRGKSFGLWSLNACRVVYMINEPRRFGFAYGTLPDHVERGEERFIVEWLDDNSVWYDLYAFSRPQHPLARLGSPLTRMLQKRFARESLTAMRAAVK